MRTLPTLFDEVAAALQFPLVFGENMDGFNECMAELESLPPGRGFVLTIVEPDEVLADAGQDELSWFLRSLEYANGVWGQAIESGEWWDRPAIPFHVVLADEPDAIALAAHRWSAIGAQPVPLPQTRN